MAHATLDQPALKLIAKSKITTKGQITLPIEVRNRLGVKAGESVQFAVENGRTIVLPVREEENPFEKWIGALPAFRNVGEVNDWVSEMRDDEDRKADLADWREFQRLEALKAK